MERTWYKILLGLIKIIFIGLSTGLVNGSNRTQCVSLNSKKCMTQSTLINLHPNEYSQEFHYFPFAVKLDRCVGSCNTLNDLSSKVCIWISIIWISKVFESKRVHQYYRNKQNIKHW